MRAWSGTTRRLVAAFGAIVLLFALASYSALTGLEQIRVGLAMMREHDAAVRLSLELASAVRDQYAHQAHTIILGNSTHMGFYHEASAHVRVLVEGVRDHCATAEQRGWLIDIDDGSRELDRLFAEQIMPAVMAGQSAVVQRDHASALALVSLIQARTDSLVQSFDTAILAFQKRVGELEDRTFAWTVFFLVGAPLLAALVVLYLGRSIARPLTLLQQGALRLASGDLTTRIEMTRQDEFGALARQFNAMTAALREHERKLVESEKLAGIGRLAAGVAHEINNPLGVILGYVRILAKTAAPPLALDLKVIEDETLRCQEIVEGLLDLSRPLAASREPIDLRALCEEIRALLLATPQLRGVRIALVGEGQCRGVVGRVRQVLRNLIKNAAEAAGEGGAVTVEIRTVADFTLVAVSDNGPGFDETARDRLFEPFYTTKADGTGLGLAVSRAIAHAFGGDIEAASTPNGARFVLRLPSATDPHD